MIKVTILYPVHQQDWFDLDYYIEKHVPLSKSIFGSSLKGIAIEERSDEDTPDKESTYRIIGHLFFEKTADFYEKYLPNKEILFADALKYTNISPVLQISKVLLWQTPWI